MSDLQPGPDDPLTALRRQDHRPHSVVLRERALMWLRERAAKTPPSAEPPDLGPPHKRRSRPAIIAIALVAVVLLTSAGVRTFVAPTDAPIEDGLPFANPSSESQGVSDSGQSSEATLTQTVESSLPPAQRPSETSAEIIVHVAGAVDQPGLIRGREGWRVDDAVRAAGGADPGADLDRLNLAALVFDGERIFVPQRGQEPPGVLEPTGGQGSATGDTASAPVDVNRASVEELQNLSGVGPATAASIIAHRDQHGQFASVDALVAVSGIGPATVESLRDHVTVG